MRTDRELLELAAKAAGVGPVLCYESARNCLRVGDRESYKVWQPLTKDGDAFTLMVALNFEVEKSAFGNRFYVGRSYDAKWMEDSDDHWIGVDGIEGARNRAFRYAIVRAAAEIGAAM